MGAQSNNHHCPCARCPRVRQDPWVRNHVPGLVHTPARPAGGGFPKRQLSPLFIMLIITTTTIIVISLRLNLSIICMYLLFAI